MKKILLLIILGVLSQQTSIADDSASTLNPEPWDKWAESNPSWVEALPPFNIIDNIYYVGTKGIASYLITSNQGHILLDGGMPQNPPLIINSIEALGFEPSDIKILLNSHAHFDHSGGLAELKQITGAKLIASALDSQWLESGLYPGSDNLAYSSPAVLVDKKVEHQQLITLGDITLKANITPGHTPGCTSWSTSAQVASEEYQVLFFCSASVAGNRLVGPPQYPGIVADYRLTFERTRDWKPDVFLSNHPFFFNMHAKREKQLAGEKLAFVDRSGFPTLISELEVAFEEALKAQRVKLEQSNLER